MKEPFEIVIAGGGTIGMCAAALLAQSRHRDRLRITLIDARPRPISANPDEVDLRVSALSLGSVSILEQLGAWASVEARRVSPFEGMRVWDARGRVGGKDTLRFDAADFAIPALGYIVENVLVRESLLAVLAQGDVDLRFATPVEGIQRRDAPAGFDVQLADGLETSPNLLIGADGSDSRIRSGARIPTRAWHYPQLAFVTHVRPAEPHRGVAWQRFLRDGPIALLPLADGRVSIVWSTSPDRVKQALAASDRDLGRSLTEASDNVLGELAADGPRASFPLRAQHALRYVEPGLALIGDAAHSVHPLAGQGANLGFADALSLAEAVNGALDNGEFPGDLPTLRRYERARRGANATMLHFIDSLNRLFMSEKGWLIGLRTRGMRLFNRSGPIRRKAVAVALGIDL